MINVQPSHQPLIVCAGLIHDQGRFLITQRPPGSWMEGYWEFPGGKLDGCEDPRAALVREIQEELHLSVEVGSIEEVILYHYPDRSVLLLFFWCRVLQGTPASGIGQAFVWVTAEQMKSYPFLPADEPLVAILNSKPVPSHQSNPG